MLNVIAELLTKYFSTIKKKIKESKTKTLLACCRLTQIFFIYGCWTVSMYEYQIHYINVLFC